MWHYDMERSRVPLNGKRGEQLKTSKWKHGKRKRKMKKRDKQVKDSEKIIFIVGVIAIVSIMILGVTCN